MRILLAMPVYNEAAHVGDVVRQVRQYVPDILVVDDGSTDGTSDLLKQTGGIYLIRHGINRGYGQALRSAFCFSIARHYDWLITMDCDGQHEHGFLPQFLAAIAADDADIISGSRYLRQEANEDLPPPDRLAINTEITAWLNRQLRLSITDAFCGFKAYRVRALRQLHVTEAGYAMPLQVWAQAAQAKLRIREIPVRLVYNDPNRHFGGRLDEPEFRRRHYLAVLKAAVAESTQSPAQPHPAKSGRRGCRC